MFNQKLKWHTMINLCVWQTMIEKKNQLSKLFNLWENKENKRVALG